LIPTHLRFTNGESLLGDQDGGEVWQNGTLSNILAPSPYNYAGTQLHKPDMFYYEILELSLKELEQRKASESHGFPMVLSRRLVDSFIPALFEHI